jgi:ribA/ribD-fused uncharacterized protein
VVIEGVTYNCVEQHMMVQKARVFNDPATEKLIMATNIPREQKLLGRKVAGFDADIWKGCCLELVLPAIVAKFEQNAALGQLLLTTGDKKIAEASPYDQIWGIGLSPDDLRARDPKNWAGANFLGELLMIARTELRAQEARQVLADQTKLAAAARVPYSSGLHPRVKAIKAQGDVK